MPVGRRVVRPVDPRLLRRAGAARPFVVGVAALGAGTAALVIAQADLLARVITRAFLGHAGLAVLGTSLVLLAAVVLGRAVLAWLTEVAAHRASATVLAQLRAELIGHVLRGPGATADRSPAELAQLATRGLDGLDGYFARYLPQLLLAVVVPVAVGVRILAADWVAAAIVAATVPLIPLFMILIGLYTQRDVRRQWRTLAVLANHFVDIVAGLAVLTAFGRARRQARTIREITERYRTQTMRTLRVAFLSGLALELLATLSVAMIAVSVGLRLVTGGLDLQTALVVLILAPEVYFPLRAVGARYHDSAEGLAAADEVFAVLASGERAGSAPAPDPARVPLRLREVRVAGRGGTPILESLNLDIRPGRVLGITGASGAGKSTLLDLLLGRRRPDAGDVRAGGVAIADLDPRSWLARIAWVPQQPRLVAGTVADNIRLALPQASDDAVRAAATAAALDVPLHRQVGELGAGLSTGQQRRVALARALLADRPLLLLDEPTEGVDAGTEAAILAALPSALAGRTAVLVSHHDAVLACCHDVVTLPQHQVPVVTRPDRTAPAPSTPDTARSGAAPARRAASAAAGVRPWRWLAAAVRPYRGRLALAAAAGAGSLASGVALTATSAWLISSAALHPPVLTLMVAIVAVRAFGIARPVLRYLERLASHDTALRLLGDLRVRVWHALVRLGPAVTARLRSGDLLTSLVSDVDAQQDVLVRGLVPFTAAAVVGAGVAAGLGLLVPAAGVAALAGLLVAGVAGPAVAVLAGHAAERRSAGLRAAVTRGTVELLRAAPDLVAFGAAAPRLRALRALDERHTRALRTSAWARGAGVGLSTLAVGATMIACTALGIVALASGAAGLPGPALAVLALTPLAAADLVLGLPDAAQRLLGARDAARRLGELEVTPAAATEPDVPLPVPATGPLAAERLAVRWPAASADAVRDVSLAVAPGGRVALTGPSGAGKSTVLAALMRQLDPSAGTVRLAGLDTARCPGDEVRRRVAWCGPDAHLFDSTLRENLRLACPGAPDERLVAGLRLVRLGAWFDGLPDGLDTRLGTHGTGVSGGERQRIGLARALLADRPVLLLDEPTAHLDRPTATALTADLRALTAERAALIVTHRPGELPGVPVVRLPPDDHAARANQAPSCTHSATGTTS